MECHLTVGGHRGRDATAGKIKERYNWSYYYKEVEQKQSPGRYNVADTVHGCSTR